jgi:signal peptidase I
MPVGDPGRTADSAGSGAQPELPAELGAGTHFNPGWGSGLGPAATQGQSLRAAGPDPAPRSSGSWESADRASAKSRHRKARPDKPNRPLIRELPILIVVALIIAIVIKTFVVQAFVIPTGSMQDTLEINDKILVDKLVYHFRPIHAGDIIVFDGSGSWNAPAQSSGAAPNLLARAYDDTLRKLFDSIGGLFGSPIGQTDYVKRVIGVPGDHVVCCNAQGLITVNGVPLHEQSYLYPGDQPSSHSYSIPGHFNVTVPPGYLWVLGDHRAVSDDSRGHEADPGNGMIPENMVIGRAFVIVWPQSQWRVLPIPATFQQPGITKASGSAAGHVRIATVSATLGVRPEAPYLPVAAGFAGAIPLTWLRRRALTRRSKARRATASSLTVRRLLALRSMGPTLTGPPLTGPPLTGTARTRALPAAVGAAVDSRVTTGGLDGDGDEQEG